MPNQILNCMFLYSLTICVTQTSQTFTCYCRAVGLLLNDCALVLQKTRSLRQEEVQEKKEQETEEEKQEKTQEKA